MARGEGPRPHVGGGPVDTNGGVVAQLAVAVEDARGGRCRTESFVPSIAPRAVTRAGASTDCCFRGRAERFGGGPSFSGAERSAVALGATGE